MAKINKATLRHNAVKRCIDKVAKVKDDPFKNVSMRDIMLGFTNKSNTKREVKTKANGYRWTVQQVMRG